MYIVQCTYSSSIEQIENCELQTILLSFSILKHIQSSSTHIKEISGEKEQTKKVLFYYQRDEHARTSTVRLRFKASFEIKLNVFCTSFSYIDTKQKCTVCALHTPHIFLYIKNNILCLRSSTSRLLSSRIFLKSSRIYVLNSSILPSLCPACRVLRPVTNVGEQKKIKATENFQRAKRERKKIRVCGGC